MAMDLQHKRSYSYSMKNRKKILLVYANYSTFVRQDDEILSEEHDVSKYRFLHEKNPIRFFWQFIRQFVFLLLKGWQFDAFYIWFADYHSLLPVLFARISGKKSFLVIGGYDAARIKSFKYGVFYKKWRGFFAIHSMRKSSKNLCVSKHILRTISHIAPNSENTLIYNCVGLATPKTSLKKECLVLTVAIVKNELAYRIKGIDLFIEAAGLLPDYTFQIVGIDRDLVIKKFNTLPPNLILTGLIPHDELNRYYQTAKVYCQFSVIESFCVALAEAMLYNCIPVTTAVGGMAEVAGGLGLTVKRGLASITQAIIQAMNTPSSDDFRKQILTNFSIEKRRDELRKILF